VSSARLNSVLVAAVFGVAALWRSGTHLSHDAAWFLMAAERILDGAVLYRDIIEVNPPLGIWAVLPIVALSRATGLDVIVLYTAGVFLLAALSLRICDDVLARSGGPERTLVPLLCLTMLLVPGGDFGQREHLLLILSLPYFLLRSLRLRDAPVPLYLAVTVGVLAAIGIGMKVHALLAVIAAEAACAMLDRRRSKHFPPEFLAFLLASVVHVLSVWIAAPLFFTDNIPLGVAAYLPYYRVQGFSGMARVILVTFLALLLIREALRRQSPLAPLSIVVGAISIGFSLAYALQAGFRYQFLPAAAMSVVALGLLAIIIRERLARIVISCVVATKVLAGAVGSLSYNGAFFEASIDSLRIDARSFFIASTNVSHGFPLALERGLHWTSRFPTQWLAPYVADSDPEDSIARFAREAVVEDLLAGKPDIVFIDRRPRQDYFKGPPLDFLSFWGGDPRFSCFWTQYRLAERRSGFDIWTRVASRESGDCPQAHRLLGEPRATDVDGAFALPRRLPSFEHALSDWAIDR